MWVFALKARSEKITTYAKLKTKNNNSEALPTERKLINKESIVL